MKNTPKNASKGEKLSVGKSRIYPAPPPPSTSILGEKVSWAQIASRPAKVENIGVPPHLDSEPRIGLLSKLLLLLLLLQPLSLQTIFLIPQLQGNLCQNFFGEDKYLENKNETESGNGRRKEEEEEGKNTRFLKSITKINKTCLSLFINSIKILLVRVYLNMFAIKL